MDLGVRLALPRHACPLNPSGDNIGLPRRPLAGLAREDDPVPDIHDLTDEAEIARELRPVGIRKISQAPDAGPVQHPDKTDARARKREEIAVRRGRAGYGGACGLEGRWGAGGRRFRGGGHGVTLNVRPSRERGVPRTRPSMPSPGRSRLFGRKIGQGAVPGC